MYPHRCLEERGKRILYLAHIRESDGGVQPFELHCRNAATLCSVSVRFVDPSKMAELIGLMHDMDKETKQVVMLCILGHHAGLADCLNPAGRSPLPEKLKHEEGRVHAEKSDICWKKAASAPSIVIFTRYDKRDIVFAGFILFAMILDSLVRTYSN